MRIGAVIEIVPLHEVPYAQTVGETKCKAPKHIVDRHTLAVHMEHDFRRIAQIDGIAWVIGIHVENHRLRGGSSGSGHHQDRAGPTAHPFWLYLGHIPLTMPAQGPA